jgi:hypothetical protein
MKIVGSFSFENNPCGTIKETPGMEKHIKLVAVLNIVYQCTAIIGSIVLFFLAAVFGRLMDFLERTGDLRADEVPHELLNILPFVFVVIGALIAIVSIVAIVGSIGVLKRQEWGRITLIVISFFNLFHLPLGTALGVYTLWVLFNDEIVKIFNPRAPGEAPKLAT